MIMMAAVNKLVIDFYFIFYKQISEWDVPSANHRAYTKPSIYWSTEVSKYRSIEVPNIITKLPAKIIRAKNVFNLPETNSNPLFIYTCTVALITVQVVNVLLHSYDERCYILGKCLAKQHVEKLQKCNHSTPAAPDSRPCFPSVLLRVLSSITIYHESGCTLSSTSAALFNCSYGIANPYKSWLIGACILRCPFVHRMGQSKKSGGE